MEVVYGVLFVLNTERDLLCILSMRISSTQILDTTDGKVFLGFLWQYFWPKDVSSFFFFFLQSVFEYKLS